MARAFPVSYEQLTVESAALTARCRISSAARIGHWPVILALWTGVEVRMVERLRHLVVVVPGIGGSVLVTPERAVWDGGVVHLAASLLRPSRLDLTDQPKLVPVGLVPKIGFAGPLALPGYASLVASIRAGFRDVRVDTARHDGAIRDSRADLVLFPYDFRSGVRAAALRLRDEIERRLDLLASDERAKAGRGVVIAHSMGGLVARYWLGPLGGAGRGAALITLGTSHRGALAGRHGDGLGLAGRRGQAGDAGHRGRRAHAPAGAIPGMGGGTDGGARIRGGARHPGELAAAPLAG